jgi:hypothetical protein
VSTTCTDKHTAIVELLLSVDDSSFRQIVNDETRDFNRPSSPFVQNAVDQDEMKALIRAAIRDPQVLRRWHTTVLLMHKDLEGQFAAKTADMNAKVKELQLRNGKHREILMEQASFEKWRAGALRVKTGLETRLIESRYLMDREGVGVPGEYAIAERNAAYARVHTLEEAIRRHRDRTLAEVDGDFEQTEHDEELWRYVS